MNIHINDPFFDEKIKAQSGLYKVLDPERFVNVIDLGLSYELDVNEQGEIKVATSLSTPHCPMGEAMTNGVKDSLEQDFPERKGEVNLAFDPPWSFEMLSEEGRAQF